MIEIKKGSSCPKPFYCKGCGEPITKVRVLSHGMCYKCRMREYTNEYKRLHPIKFKRQSYNAWKTRKDRGYKTVCNYSSVVVCRGCGEHIKGNYSGFGKKSGLEKRIIRCRWLVCPHCRYVYRKGSPIEVIRVKKIERFSSSIQTFDQWNVYRKLPDVKTFIESLPEKTETIEELRERVKVRPLTQRAFRKFHKKNRMMIKEAQKRRKV